MGPFIRFPSRFYVISIQGTPVFTDETNNNMLTVDLTTDLVSLMFIL